MKVGDKVQVNSDTTVHPSVRGREGVVKEFGAHGVVGVVLAGERGTRFLDPSILTVLSPPPQENSAQEPILPFIPN